MKPLVSVIICVYNCEKYLKRAIESVLNQSYKNLEILVINDGSTDSTSKICDRFLKDRRVRVFHKKNGGLADARNFGIKNAKGEYITFLDADDEYLANYIERLLEVILKFNTKMSICGYTYILKSGKKIKSSVYLEDCCKGMEECIREYAKNDKVTSHSWGKLYNKILFQNIEYPFGKNYEDIYVMPQLLDLCDHIAFVNENLLNYYQVSGSITNSRNIKNEFYAFKATLIKFEKYNSDELYEYLVKEPVEIALRIKLYLKKNQLKDDFHKEIYEINNFLKKVSLDIRTYKKLNLKFKIALLLNLTLFFSEDKI